MEFVLPIEKIPCISVLQAELEQLSPAAQQDGTQARIAQRIATIKQKVEAGETSETKYIGSVKAMRKYLVKVIETNRPGTAQAKNWLQHVDSEISDFEEHAAQQILNRGCEEQAPNPGYNMAAIATATRTAMAEATRLQMQAAKVAKQAIARATAPPKMLPIEEWPDLDLDMFDRVMAQESGGAPSMYGSDQWMSAQAAPIVQAPAAQAPAAQAPAAQTPAAQAPAARQPVAQTDAQQRRAAAALIDDQVARMLAEAEKTVAREEKGNNTDGFANSDLERQLNEMQEASDKNLENFLGADV